MPFLLQRGILVGTHAQPEYVFLGMHLFDRGGGAIGAMNPSGLDESLWNLGKTTV
jgi:hypothetical protein